MVLVTPILLLVMALIINYGTAACWKARCDAVARNIVWSDRDPRQSSWMPVPQNWKVPNATQGLQHEADLSSLDDPRLRLPVVRGPMPFGTVVNGDLLNPATGFNAGRAGITRNFPLLAKLPNYHFDVENALLDKGWEYWRMGLRDNAPRWAPFRVPLLYSLSQPPAGNAAAFQQAEMALLNAPFAAALDPLNNDADWRRYAGYAPDFHAHMCYHCAFGHCSPCTTNLKEVEDWVKRCLTVRRLGGRIPLVPKTMTQRFLWLYRQTLQMTQDPATMALLQQYISQLQQFDATLP